MHAVTQILRALWRPLHLMALLGLLLASAAPAQAQQWRECAREGQICRLDGRGVVRYGVDGQWASRAMNGNVMCSNDVFGDPAPQQVKRCEVRSDGGGNNNAKGWVFCAAEGEVCHLRGSAEVRFGADQKYTVRRAFNRIECDVESFGDPVYGRTKHCEVRAEAAVKPGNNAGPWSGWNNNSNDNNRWRYCASEDQTCHVRGPAEVRYGDGQRFNTRKVNGNVTCSNTVFGDPAFGVIKHCEVRASSFGGWGQGGVVDGGWTRCADEGGTCQVGSSRVQVRFGTQGRYVYRDVYGGLGCNVNAFGSDPYPGQRKQCEMRR